MDPISAGANLLGSVFNVVQQNKTNEHNASMLDKQNQFNRDMQKDQQQYNKEMWDKQNAYNTPQSQLDRYRKAGLNPNLLYGQPNPGNAAQVATSGQATSSNAIARNAPTVDPLSMSAIQLNQAMARKNQEEAKGQEIENKYKGDKESLGVENQKEQLNKIRVETEKLGYQARIEYFNQRVAENTVNERINKYVLDNNLTQQQAENYEALTYLYEYQKLTEEAKAANLSIHTKAISEKLPYEIKQISSEIRKNDTISSMNQVLSKLYQWQIFHENPYQHGSKTSISNQLGIKEVKLKDLDADKMKLELTILARKMNIEYNELLMWIKAITGGIGDIQEVFKTGSEINKNNANTLNSILK